VAAEQSLSLYAEDVLTCSACGRRFVDDGAFRRHRRRGQCLDPPTVVDEHGAVFVEVPALQPPVYGVRDR
jgi:hypothetical protein